MGWLSGYQYRKKVTISGSSGAGENYQVKLSIGSSSGGDFHLEGHCVDFPNDIRFTDDDGETLLDYWIEDPTQDPITVWVKVKDSLDTDVDIFVYYGQSGVSSASDGEACLLPNTLICTSDGIKQIKDVKEGDLVFTHKGRWKRVLKVLRRHFIGSLIKILPYHLPSVSFTPEHPIYAIKTRKCPSHFGVSKGEGRICRIESCRYRGRDFCQGIFESYEPRWCFADELEKGDYVLLSFPTDVKDVETIKISDLLDDVILEKKWIYSVGKNQYGAVFKIGKGIPNKILVNEEFMRLAGYYLAEGFITEKGIEFAFGSHEKEYIKDACEIITRIFGLIPSVKDGATNTKRIIVYSMILKRFFALLFGSRAAEKQIPEFMMKLSHEKQFALLQGLFRGDGCFYNRKQQKITYSSISVNLAYQIFLLLARQGILATFKQIRDKGKYNIQGRIGNQAESYGIEIFNDFAEVFESKKRKQKKFEPKCGLIDRERGYVILPIRKIEYEPYDGCVYNLEVQDDNSYNTLSMSIHNCFEFFDDFEGTSLNTSKWTEENSPSITVSNGECHISSDATDEGIKSINTFPVNRIVEFELKWDETNVLHRVNGFSSTNENRASFNGWYDGNLFAHSFLNNAYTETNCGAYDTLYHSYKIERIGGNTDKFYVDGELKATHTTNVCGDNLNLRFISNSGGNIYLRIIKVRKYADPEPTFSSVGSEETPSLTCIDIGSFSSFSTLNKKTYPVCLDTFQSSDVSNSLLSLISCSQDTLGLTDSNTLFLLIFLNALDTVRVSDECTLTFEISPSCLETLRLLESPSLSLEGLVRCLDNIGTKTSLSSLLSAVCQSSDNIGGIDNELSHMLISSILTDKLHSQDASVSNIAFGRSVLDILVCQDTSSLLKGIILSATDILNAQDLTEIHLIISSSSIDIVKQRDTSIVNVTFHLSGEDIFKGEDFVSSSLQTVLSALDSFKVSDSSLSGTFAEILVSASDILATSDYNEIHFEFLQSAIDIIKSDDASSPIISFQLNIVDILQGLDTLTANLQAILGAISKFKSSGETSSYEVILGIPIKIFKAQEKVLVFRAKKKPFRFQVR